MSVDQFTPAAALAAHRFGLSERLLAAFDAFLAPERLLPAGNDNDGPAQADHAGSLTEPLALPPDWHSGGDLLSLSFLPFER